VIVKQSPAERKEANLCVEAWNEAIHRFVAPEIFNTDQGNQFTSFVWTDRLKRAGIKISMDGKGWFLDNMFIEQLWRPIKYECIYLHAWVSGSEAIRWDQKVASRRCEHRLPTNKRSSTITSAHILPLAVSHLMWSTGREMKQTKSISRCKE